MTIPEVLSSRFPEILLSGFKKGYFDTSTTRFYAYSVLSMENDDLKTEFNSLQSYSYDHSGNYEETFTINNGDGTFCYKELSQLLEEKVFEWVAIKFYGVLHQGDWYTRKEVTFFEKGSEEAIIEKLEEFYSTEMQNCEHPYFANIPPVQLEIDFDKVSEMVSSQLKEPRTITNNWKKVWEYYDTIPKGEIPKREIPQYQQYREFIGIPRLVAYEKQESKEKVNKEFESYINQEVFLPFARCLHKNLQADFNVMPNLIYGMHFPLIYPHSKEHVLVIIRVFNREGDWILFYFLYVSKEKIIFQWTFPEQVVVSQFMYPTNPDIERFSQLGYEFNFEEPSVTMDDESFWKEYIFKKDGDQYLYLQPVDVKNSQPDIFTQW